MAKAKSGRVGEMRAGRCWCKAACLVDHGGDLSFYSEQGKSPGKVLSRGWTGCELGSNKTPLAECGEWTGVGTGAGQKPGDQGLLQQSSERQKGAGLRWGQRRFWELLWASIDMPFLGTYYVRAVGRNYGYRDDEG